MKLAACPFCDKSNPFIHASYRNEDGVGTPDWYEVQCQNCVCDGPPGEDETEAVKAWNQRIPLKEAVADHIATTLSNS